MPERLHTRSKIFWSDPYVVRVEYSSDQSLLDSSKQFRDHYRSAYKLIKGTWGYSTIEPSVATTPDPSPTVISSRHYMGPHLAIIYRAYFCFQDEMDALQFRLSLNTSATQVFMWPSNILYTIHEYVADEPEDY